MPADDDTNPLVELVREVADSRGKIELLTSAQFNEMAVNSDLRIQVAALLSRLEAQERAAQIRADALATLARVAERAFDWLSHQPDPNEPGRSRAAELRRLVAAGFAAGSSVGGLVEVAHRMGWL